MIVGYNGDNKGLQTICFCQKESLLLWSHKLGYSDIKLAMTEHSHGVGRRPSICQDLCKRYFAETTLVKIGVGRAEETTRGYGIIKCTSQVPDTEFLMPLEFPE